MAAIENPILTHEFKSGTKRICDPDHIPVFLKSSAFRDMNNFFCDLAIAIRAKPLSFDCPVSPFCANLITLLDQLDTFVDEIPPIEQATRYGNKAFRLWQDRLAAECETLLRTTILNVEDELYADEEKERILVLIEHGILNELETYFRGSFGDKMRIDYGTGHELCFMCFLYVLKFSQFFGSADYPAIVLRVFNRYILLMRKIQSTYFLEPAGSRGVWGLDDYQFLTFFFGAAQLSDHPRIKPEHILEEWALAEADEYMYLSCIKFILQMKRGHFSEHSPLLYDISGVPFWGKVKSGLFKMYEDDVWKKYPVIQHFFFGSVLTVDLPEMTAEEHANQARAKQLAGTAVPGVNARYNPPPPTGPPPGLENESLDDMIVTKAPWAK